MGHYSIEIQFKLKEANQRNLLKSDYSGIEIKQKREMYSIKKKEKILKKDIALALLAACLFAVTFFMILSQILDISIFFVIWLICILIAVELITPVFLQPMYIKYAKYIIAIGILIFGGIVLNKILEILL